MTSSRARWAGPVLELQSRGQGGQAAVGHLGIDQAAGQSQGVDDEIVERGTFVLLQGGVQEREVESHVVPDQDGAVDELHEGGQDTGHRRRVAHHVVADAGEGGDERGNGVARVDQGGEGAQAFAAPELGRRHFGQGAGLGAEARRLDVDDAEGDVVER